MSPQKLDKKGLDDNLSYYINNKNDVSVIVYAILKNSPIAYRMDIEGSAQNGLKELFLDSLKRNIIDNHELGVLSLSSADERNNVTEKLRGERQYCRQVTTFVRTSPFAVKEPCYSNAAVEKLPLPTQDSRDIIAAACRALNHVWREGYRYMKAGVMLADFTPSGIAQPGLFDEIQPRKNSEKLMKTLDELNQSGKGTVWFAGRGTAPEWQMKREMLSPAYTTRWTDLPVAQL